MSNGNEAPQFIGPEGGGPKVSLHRLGEIRTFEVMEGDLDNVNAAMAEEGNGLGFASGLLGAFVGLVGSVLTSGWPSDDGKGALLGAMLVTTAVLGVWFAKYYWRKRKHRVELLTRIKSARSA